MRVEVEATVKGGFPVLVSADVCPAEPDVGIVSSFLEGLEVKTRQGKPCPWLKLSARDIDDLEQSVWGAVCGC